MSEISLVDHFVKAIDGRQESDFNLFEPFDVAPRPQWLMDRAKSANLGDLRLQREGGPFQLGYMMDATPAPHIVIILAGSQSGKSMAVGMDTLIIASGRIPLAFRHAKGEDTGVPRKVTPENIKRFGGSVETGCGNVIGVGYYPREKLCPAGKQIWICCPKEIRESYWKPLFKRLIEPGMLDQSRGVGGYSESIDTYFFHNDIIIKFITYEQGYKRVEGVRAWLIVMDEEPFKREFYTGILEHSHFMRSGFTPINGLSWTYQDLFIPIITGRLKESRIYHCTQYDSPYQNRADIDYKIDKLYKPWEISPKVWGVFSEMVGAPYYPEIVRQSVQVQMARYLPTYTPWTIMPAAKCDSVNDAMNASFVLQKQDEDFDGCWHVYEDIEHIDPKDAYWLSADVAEGDPDPDKAQDHSIAYIRRLPRKEQEEEEPVLTASLETGMRNVEFTWHCLYAAIWFNNALLCPEARGEDGGVFVATAYDYPYFYRHIVTSDKTHRQKEMLGFDTVATSRKLIFEFIGTYFMEHDKKPFPDYGLMREFVACIKTKAGRPDHDEHGTTDRMIAFGISEYVYRLANAQICARPGKRHSTKKEDFYACLLSRKEIHREQRPLLGTDRGMDFRTRFEQNVTGVLAGKGQNGSRGGSNDF